MAIDFSDLGAEPAKKKIDLSDLGAESVRQESNINPILQQQLATLTAPERAGGAAALAVSKAGQETGVNPLAMLAPGVDPRAFNLQRVLDAISNPQQTLKNLKAGGKRVLESTKPGFKPTEQEKLPYEAGRAATNLALTAPAFGATGAIPSAVGRIGANTAIGAGLSAIEQGSEGNIDPNQVGKSALSAGVPSAIAESGPFIKFTAKQISRLASGLSGIKVEDIQRLFDKPGTIFAPSLAKAKKAYGELKAASGGNLPVDEETAFEAASKTAKDLIRKSNESGITSIEALEARQAIDEVIGATKSGRKLNKLKELRNITDALVKADPNLAKADAIYEASAQAAKFRHIFPVNKNGTPSIARTAIGAFLSGKYLNPVPSVMSSPLAVGAATSLAGAATKAISPVLNATKDIYPALGFSASQYKRR